MNYFSSGKILWYLMSDKIRLNEIASDFDGFSQIEIIF